MPWSVFNKLFSSERAKRKGRFLFVLLMGAAVSCGGKTQTNQAEISEDEPSDGEPQGESQPSVIRLLVGTDYVDVLDANNRYHRLWGAGDLEDREGVTDATAGVEGMWLFGKTGCEYVPAGPSTYNTPFPLCPKPRDAVNANNRLLVV